MLPAEPWEHDQSDLRARVDRLERRVARERARREATEHELEAVVAGGLRDGLTGLVTRTTLLVRLRGALDRATRSGASVGLLLLDLDAFDAVTRDLGAAGSDAVLAAVAGRLEALAGPMGTVARMGTDEFAVLLPQAGTAAELSSFAEKVGDVLDEPCHAGGRPVRLRASTGLSLASPDEAAETVLREAEAALYVARNGGTSRTVLFEAARSRRAASRRFEVDLLRALASGEIEPYFQPVVRLDTGALVGAEALARWHHRDRGEISPLEFVREAEDNGLVHLLTDRILSESAARLAGWNQGRDEGFLLHVNVSGRELSDEQLVPRVGSVLEESGVAPGTLCLEITERALVSDDRVVQRNLTALRDLGVPLAIDDFGIEYSSFSYLRRFPVEILKIDRSFVQDVADDGRDRAVIAGMVAMAAALGMRTVAEGVETLQQAEVLRDLGVDEGQGWLFGRPVPADRVTWERDPAPDTSTRTGR